MRYLAAYAGSLLAFIALDASWISLMFKRLYQPVMGEMLSPKPRFGAVAAFYLVYVAGVTVLATAPALKEVSAGRAALSGAVLGAVAYATYDLTNQATLRIWSTRLSIIDIAWGACATAVAALAGYALARLVAK